MSTHPCVTQLIQRDGPYQVLNTQYCYPVQQQQPQALSNKNNNNTKLQVIQNQNAPIPVTVANMVSVVPINDLSQASSGQNPPIGEAVFIIDNNCYVQQTQTNVCDVYGGTQLMTNMTNNVGQVHVLPNLVQKTQVPHTDQINIGVQENDGINTLKDYPEGINTIRNDFEPGFQKSKPPERPMKGLIKIPEPTQVKVSTDQRERIGQLKIQVSGSFLSWNVAGRTILDLNFMRNLFYITNLDFIFQSETPYETGLCEGLNKLVQNKLFSDWLVLKCEGKQIPFFKVNNQVEMYSVNNFSTLLSVIAQESCLPLPFITENEKKMKYYYINFPKSSNDRVRKLNVPVFHDADHGRKKIPCKYPGIRLDCTFESAIERFNIHVHNSAASAFTGYVSYIRQIIIYKHIVWGFLQAWTRRVREHYNGCFKIQDIAQNLSLCLGEPAQLVNAPSAEQDLIYYIDYSNFYLKFDPVALKDTAMAFTIENFETNYVCDVSIVQYYRQFFLINNMHYSDALKNIILFSEENGASKVTDFVYMQPKDDKVDGSNPGFFTPGGISRTSVQKETGQTNKNTAKPNMPSNLKSTKPTKQQQFNPQNDSSSFAASKIIINANVSLNNNQMTNNNEQVPPKTSALLKPLIKTRTVEEINSSVELNRNSEVSYVRLNSYQGNQAKQVNLTFPAYIRQILNDCFKRNSAEIAGRDSTVNPPEIQRLFTDALTQAIKMTTIEAFIDKMYVTLQKSFTNSTSQNIMNRLIYRAIERKFPHLKAMLKPGLDRSVPPPPTVEASPQKIRKIKRSPQGESVKASQLNQNGKDIPVKETEKMPAAAEKVLASPVKTTLPASSKSSTPSIEVCSQVEHSYTKNPLKETEKTATHPKPSPMNQSEFNLKQCSSQIVADKSNSDESSCKIKCKINEKEEQTNEWRKSAKESVRDSQKVKKSVKDNGNVTRTNAIVIETDDSISIRLTLPLSQSPESVALGATPKIVSVSEQSPELELINEEESNQREESSSESAKHGVQTGESGFTEGESSQCKAKEKDLFERFNLKPCSVMLNVNAVALYQNRRNGLRKRQRNVMYNVSNALCDDSNDILDDGDDAKDNDFVLPEPSSKKKTKKVSDLEYMEARTRVIQRLRKRNQMYVVRGDEQVVYTSDELDKFFVRQFHGNSGGKDSEEKEEQKSNNNNKKKKKKCVKGQKDEEERQYRILRNECLTRKAKVELVRLEDADMSDNQNDRWKVKTKSEGRLTLMRDHSIEYENIPKNKRRYFEMREGKLYLKDQYRVNNGKIVLVVNPEAGQNRPSLKNEVNSAHNESDFPQLFIKQEKFSE